jgi:hypothetical protein
MSTLYPKLPVEPLDRNGHYPDSLHDLPNGTCPVCKVHWTTIRSYAGSCAFHSDMHKLAIPPFPHLAYACGGIWRDIGSGYWEGKCWAMKTRQLLLHLVVEDDT